MPEFIPPIPKILPSISDRELDAILRARSVHAPDWVSRPGRKPHDGYSHINLRCVTCKGEGSFLGVKGGEPMEFACPCLDQWTLDALFVSAQIVKSLRVLGITDATGLPDDSLDVLDDWMGSDKERRGLVLIGDHASGKTLMASLIMRNYLKRGMTAYLTRIDDMRDAATAGFDESGDAREEANYRYDRKVRNVDLLVVDEMDSVSKTTEFMQENFSRILRAREGNLRPTLLLSRRDSDWIRQKYYDAAGMIGSMEIHKIERGPWGQKDIERKANETSLGITRPRVLE